MYMSYPVPLTITFIILVVSGSKIQQMLAHVLIKSLQTVQNSTAWLVACTHKQEPITPVLNSMIGMYSSQHKVPDLYI